MGLTYNLNNSLFDYCHALAKKRMQQKESYKSSNPLSKNYELVGILGECIYGLLTGELLDTRLKQKGDDGYDFKGGVQVKTSEKHKAKHLIEYKNKDFSKFKYYVFIVVDLENKTGEVIGYISVKDFLANKKIINFGYGERYAIDLTKLKPIND